MMRPLPNWSNASAGIHLEWRPSRALALAMPVLGALAAAGMMLTELPPIAQCCLALAALVEGWRLGHGHARCARRTVLIEEGGVPRLHVDGLPAAGYRMQWRGPCLFLSWHMPGSRWQCLVFWPGQLAAGERRLLRLARQASAATGRGTSRGVQSVAP